MQLGFIWFLSQGSALVVRIICICDGVVKKFVWKKIPLLALPGGRIQGEKFYGLGLGQERHA